MADPTNRGDNELLAEIVNTNTSTVPNIRAGQYVYIMLDGDIVITSTYDQRELYRCDSAGTALRDIYSSDVNEIRESLSFIKDRGTVFQDRYEEASRMDLTGPTSQVASIWQDDPMLPATPGAIQSSDRPLGPPGATLELSGINETTLNTTPNAIDPELIKTMRKQNRFPLINRTQLEILKDLQDRTIRYNNQYLPCYGCEDSKGSLFPGGYSDSDRCVTCFRRTGRAVHKDVYIAKGFREELYKQFAEEIVPVIKKQALFEAKKRISEAEEKENKSKRTMVRIAKQRA